MDTLALDLTTWDLFVDASGNIAVAKGPYAVAQDVAGACRLFLGEYWYDTTLGVPYFTEALGQAPDVASLKAALQAAALTVPGCTDPVVYLADIGPDRVLTGQVQFTDSNGNLQVATI